MAGEIALPNDGDQVAVLSTDLGDIVVAFHDDVAPRHAANFKSLVEEGFYDGTRFHRCIAGFMVQGGDPNTKEMAMYNRWGTGAKMEENGMERRLKAEFNKTPHTRGILSAARSNSPDSASSQFFLMVAHSPHLDGQYSAFGEVVSGMDVVDQIVKTGDPRDNGKVKADAAVKINKAEMKTWPL